MKNTNNSNSQSNNTSQLIEQQKQKIEYQFFRKQIQEEKKINLQLELKKQQQSEKKRQSQQQEQNPLQNIKQPPERSFNLGQDCFQKIELQKEISPQKPKINKDQFLLHLDLNKKIKDFENNKKQKIFQEEDLKYQIRQKVLEQLLELAKPQQEQQNFTDITAADITAESSKCFRQDERILNKYNQDSLLHESSKQEIQLNYDNQRDLYQNQDSQEEDNNKRDIYQNQDSQDEDNNERDIYQNQDSQDEDNLQESIKYRDIQNQDSQDEDNLQESIKQSILLKNFDLQSELKKQQESQISNIQNNMSCQEQYTTNLELDNDQEEEKDEEEIDNNDQEQQLDYEEEEEIENNDQEKYQEQSSSRENSAEQQQDINSDSESDQGDYINKVQYQNQVQQTFGINKLQINIKQNESMGSNIQLYNRDHIQDSMDIPKNIPIKLKELKNLDLLNSQHNQSKHSKKDFDQTGKFNFKIKNDTVQQPNESELNQNNKQQDNTNNFYLTFDQNKIQSINQFLNQQNQDLSIISQRFTAYNESTNQINLNLTNTDQNGNNRYIENDEKLSIQSSINRNIQIKSSQLPIPLFIESKIQDSDDENEEQEEQNIVEQTNNNDFTQEHSQNNKGYNEQSVSDLMMQQSVQSQQSIQQKVQLKKWQQPQKEEVVQKKWQQPQQEEVKQDLQIAQNNYPFIFEVQNEQDQEIRQQKFEKMKQKQEEQEKLRQLKKLQKKQNGVLPPTQDIQKPQSKLITNQSYDDQSVQQTPQSSKLERKKPQYINNTNQSFNDDSSAQQTPQSSKQERKKPQYTKPTNKQIIINALKQVCLAGPNEKERIEVLDKVYKCKEDHYIILFKGLATGRLVFNKYQKQQDFKAIYTYDQQSNNIKLIYGAQGTPQQIFDDQVQNWYKYDSGGKEFKLIKGNKQFCVVVDAISLIPAKKNQKNLDLY